MTTLQLNITKEKLIDLADYLEYFLNCDGCPKELEKLLESMRVAIENEL